MEKLYYEDTYRRTWKAQVLACKPGKKGLFEVMLDETACYPEGGGQPSDTGILGGVKVLEVHEKDGHVVHYVDGPLEVGAVVEGTIDWERRYDNMQHHSGEHLFSGLVHRHFGYDNVGFHMGQDEVTIDFNGPLTPEQVWELEREANGLIYANVPVQITYPTSEELKKLDYRSKKELTGQVRIVEIPGGDVCACCGTHVRTTGEIGIIKITGLMNYKGGVRMSLLCGGRALKDYDKKQKLVTRISNLLSAKPETIADAVEKLKTDSGAKDGKLSQLYQKLLQFKVRVLPDSSQPLLVMEEELTPVQLRQYCTMLYEQGKGSIVLVCSEEQGVWKYAIGSAVQDVRPVSRKLNGMLHGRGGGSSLMAQGTFQAAKEEIEAVWAAGAWREQDGA